MSQKTGTLTLILSIIAAVLACVAIVMVCSSGKSEAPAAASDPSARDIQYVMYLGTNDKDTNQPVFSRGYPYFSFRRIYHSGSERRLDRRWHSISGIHTRHLPE